MCATSHKTLEHDNIHNDLKLSNRACVVKVKTSRTLQLSHPSIRKFIDCVYGCKKNITAEF